MFEIHYLANYAAEMKIAWKEMKMNVVLFLKKNVMVGNFN